MKKEHNGIVSDDKTYTHRALAEVIGRTPEWVHEHVIDEGCYTTRRGHVYFISGHSFRLWVEGNSSDLQRRKK